MGDVVPTPYLRNPRAKILYTKLQRQNLDQTNGIITNKKWRKSHIWKMNCTSSFSDYYVG